MFFNLTRWRPSWWEAVRDGTRFTSKGRLLCSDPDLVAAGIVLVLCILAGAVLYGVAVMAG